MAIKVVNTNSGQDFSACIPAILCDANGNYVAVSGVAGGTGDLVGPGSATADALAIYSGSTGKIVKNSVFTTSGNDMTIPGVLTVAGIATTAGIQVVDGGGLVSAAAGQAIVIAASSGVTISSNTGDLSLGALYGQISMATSDGVGTSSYCSLQPAELTIGNSTPGGSCVMLFQAGDITHVGNIVPNNNELTYLGIDGKAYLQVEAKTFVMKSPDGSRWALKVSDLGVVSADKLPA